MSRRPDPGRIAALFDALADLGPEEASRALDAACAGDDALREAVTRLLAADRGAASVELAPPAAVLAEALRARDAPTVAVPTGSALEATLPAADDPGVIGSARLGRFFVLRKLGEGGMGVVYVGYDERLDRRVALKVLGNGSIAADWLEREAQALGRLAHPHVVAVHEVGEDAGRVFVAMELVEGATAKAWLAERPRPFSEMLGVLLQAGRGLAAAHEAGLVHRDFKLDNVLVGADGRARVADFGIAALADPTRADRAARGAGASGAIALSRPLTPEETSMGTPGCMAPEQLRGEPATPASDQFSFCVALYRAAYRTAPFPAQDLIAHAQRVLHGEPASPPRNDDVPAWLWPIVRRGLARDPAARFASMEALLGAVERHVPRDPELDPWPLRRERVVTAAVRLGMIGVLTAVVSSQRAISVTALVVMSSTMLVLTLLVVVLRWSKLKQNRYGRRMASLIVGTVVALLAHRLIALRLGTPPEHVIVNDLVLLATFCGVVAIAMERHFGWLAACALVLATASTFDTTRALAALMVFGALALTSLLVIALRGH